jgi:hypothetical protein
VSRSAAPLLYHWSPRRNRASIKRNGLLPGQPANDGGWRPPHICLAATPTLALALCHGSPPLDLWLVHPDDCENLVAVDQEWRTTAPVSARRVIAAPHEMRASD